MRGNAPAYGQIVKNEKLAEQVDSLLLISQFEKGTVVVHVFRTIKSVNFEGILFFHFLPGINLECTTRKAPV